MFNLCISYLHFVTHDLTIKLRKLAVYLKCDRLVASNLGICATVNGQTIVKAPDWFYVPGVLLLDPPRSRRSYTPGIEGDFPAMVREFLSAVENLSLQ